MEYDVVVVGGGPAGLATAIRLKQLEERDGKELEVCIVEKGSEIGSHILSGNCFEPGPFNQLFPNWKRMENKPPLTQEVTEDELSILLSQKSSINIPSWLMTSGIKNHGNYIISLGELCAWMGEQAEEMGVDIFTGFAASEVLYDETGTNVVGIATSDMGLDKEGNPKETFQRGYELRARQTIFAEGCRGSCSEQVIERFNLREDSDPQIYGIGLKEVWEVPEENLRPGLVKHTAGWPLDKPGKEFVYGGTFMYHMAPNLIHLGKVIGLDYKNPYLNPYEEFQEWKTHPEIKKYLEGGRCIKYGARALNEGGYYSIPKLTFPGGLLVGCSAGFLDVAKIKGAHNAIESGIKAGDSVFYHLNYSASDAGTEVVDYQKKMKQSRVFKELWKSRNFHGGFKWSKYPGMALAFVSDLLGGKEFWSLRQSKPDCAQVGKKEDHKEIEYPKPDGVITFDLLENLARSGTHHDHDQPSHLKVKKGKESMPMKSLNEHAGLESRFCPAKVYEFVEDEEGNKKLQINAQNCLHCKTCSIKMVDEYIDWTVPQGSEGPEYTSM